MCGIAGIIKIHDPNDGPPPPPLDAIPEAWLDILDESIKHRGPDGQGRFRDRTTRPDGTIVDVALVHRRLSIIDHAGGHQPMVHDGDRLRPDLTYQPGETPIIASEIEPNKPIVAVVFNGCIYNHRELRAELEAAGHVFETDHSDTEVLVHGWREWKLDTQRQMDCMMACGIWDSTHASTYLARDQVGEKPLYYYYDDGCVFSSSPNGLWKLIAASHQVPLIDSRAKFELPSWIRWGYQHSSNYGLSHVEELFPDEPRVMPDYRRDMNNPLIAGGPVRSQTKPKTRTNSINADQVDLLLSQAVLSRMEADVPLSIFLSGGIDSALLAVHAHSISPDIKCLTIRMPTIAFDESKQAIETAKHLGLNHTVIECSPEPASDLVSLIEQLGLPFGDSSLLPTYWVSKAAKELCSVALSGDGADEIFAGYNRHLYGPKIHQLSKLPLLGRLLSISNQDESDPNSQQTMKARAIRAIRHEGYNEIISIFDSSDLHKLMDVPYPAEMQLPYMRGHPIDHDFGFYLPNDLLRKTDTASMAVGLEVRAPFLDRELIERMRYVRLSHIMPHGQRKGLLKQVARKYLPDHIVDRPKQGFAIPIGEWFRTDYGDMRQLLYDHLESSDPFPGLADAGVEINMKFVSQMLREHDAAGEKSINPWHGRDHSQRLYMLLVLSIWSKWLERTRSAP